MIYATVDLVIDDYKSVCDKKIVLYRGDRNVEVRFVLKGNKFIVLENTYAQMIIRRPSATSIFSEPALIAKDTVIFTISGEMIDELKEQGEYSFQIRLFDDNMSARATLPPCDGCLCIGSPIVSEEEYIVGASEVGNSHVMSPLADEYDIYDENGNYIKTDWKSGDLITEDRLNKIEDALYDAHTAKDDDIDIDLSDYALKSEIPNKTSQLENDSNFLTEIPSEYVTEMELTEISTQIDKNSNDISTILSIIDEPPTYTKPTLTATVNKSNIEHNISTAITVTPTFVQNDAGTVVSYSLMKNNEEIYSNPSPNSYSDTITLIHGESVSYKATVGYSDGAIKNTLLGIPYPGTSIKAGSISYNIVVRGYALSYYGVIDNNTIDSVDSLTSVLRTSRGSTLTFNMANQRVVYMYPKSFGNLTSIKDANNFDYINSYSLSTMIFNNVEYNVYILTDSVTITGFKQIFS